MVLRHCFGAERGRAAGFDQAAGGSVEYLGNIDLAFKIHDAPQLFFRYGLRLYVAQRSAARLSGECCLTRIRHEVHADRSSSCRIGVGQRDQLQHDSGSGIRADDST